MEVPFRSSGALSRQQYALVRKIEEEKSSQAADQLILAEIDAVKKQITHPQLSLQESKELLIILLYCESAITAAILDHGALHFALPHALSLAEAGATIADKRIGYMFCTEVMPRDHELQLMLVNTVRKDLESSVILRICLALDTIIYSSTYDMVPAVLPRLHDLLGHNSAHIRRRVLLAFRAISVHDHDILHTITHTLVRRLRDADPAIAATALVAALSYPKVDDLHTTINDLFASNPHPQSKHFMLAILRVLKAVGLDNEHLPYLVKIVRISLLNKQYSVLGEAFSLLSSLPSDRLLTLPLASRRAPVENILPLLRSKDPNERYIFAMCVGCIDPKWWAGTSPDIPAVFGEHDVQQFMRMLESPDPILRAKTMNVLMKVDESLVSTYYVQALGNILPGLSLDNRIECACRLLECVEVLAASDGEKYAKDVITLLKSTEPPASESQRVLVEKILLYIRESQSMFQMACSTIFLGYMLEDDEPGPTIMVIVAALACEYCEKLSFPAEELLNGITTKLLTMPPSVQDVCLLSMLRMTLECQTVSEDVRTVVTHLASISRRYIRKRCEQFLRLSADKDGLKALLATASTYTLPDILAALFAEGTSQKSSHTSTASVSQVASPPTSPSMSGSKLRYDAYEAPKSPARPRVSQQRPSAARHDLESGGWSGTMTPGELTLSPPYELQKLSLSPLHSSRRKMTDDDGMPIPESARSDLIAFDTPFLSGSPLMPSTMPPASSPAPSQPVPDTGLPDFKTQWESMESSTASRGWFEGSADALVKQLKTIESIGIYTFPAGDEPFVGEDKVLVRIGDSYAALRLRTDEDEECLWRMRVADAQLRVLVKRALGGE
ncbi:ARM repeat-containing protein [Cylindrobasidium torrendii FP15055 ss-10]|uniref:ARM repeat-containing protein n=1 Tax=Cylindrobasidium torrendii FP15055 ss-10 TaxID=1314674 RepID=A0A0D7B212_9AGAR|nr:ARM repeat-containing protein [Cylindrobasidium torrendii FP15055 ss-10]